VLDGSQLSIDIWLYSRLFTSIDWMPFLPPILNNANPLIALVIAPGFYLHHVVVVDQDPASGSL